MYELTKWSKRSYRVSGGNGYFGQISRSDSNKRLWAAEIRYNHTGNMKRYAGLWANLEDARSEIQHILERM